MALVPALLLSLAPVSLPGDPAMAAAGPVVTVDANERHQTIHGFGSSQRWFDDPHLTDTFDRATRRAAADVPADERERILDALYEDLGLTRVRLVLEGRGVEPVNDNSDPTRIDPSGFDFHWKRNDAHIEYARAARARGVETFFVVPTRLETWMSEDDSAEFAEWIYAIVRRWRDAGIELPYFSVINEPGYWRSGVWSGEFIRDVIKIVGPRLRADGIGTQFVVPDDLNPATAAERLELILADPQAREYVGALAFHLYGPTLQQALEQIPAVQALGVRYGLPLWMTEFSVRDSFGWPILIHDLLVGYDVAAVDYMWGFFGTSDFERSKRTSAYIGIESAGRNYVGAKKTKQYYYTGQYSRYVRPGAVRLGVRSTPPGVKISAYYHPVDRTLSLVAINATQSAQQVKVDLRGVELASFERVIRTSSSEDWTPLPALNATKDGFVLELAERSVTSFQGRNGVPSIPFATTAAAVGARASAPDHEVEPPVLRHRNEGADQHADRGAPRHRPAEQAGHRPRPSRDHHPVARVDIGPTHDGDQKADAYLERMADGDVRLLQILLTELGYEPGPADGIMGPHTRRALRAFAHRAGLGDDAASDNRTLLRALSEAAAVHGIRVSGTSGDPSRSRNHE